MSYRLVVLSSNLISNSNATTFASNAAVFASNNDPKITFGSNTSRNASNVVYPTSNAAFTGSNVAYYTSNAAFSALSNTTLVTSNIYTSNAYITGYLGVGTTGPGYRLDVQGTGRFTGAVTVASGLDLNNTGQINNMAASYQTGIRWSLGSGNEAIYGFENYNINLGTGFWWYYSGTALAQIRYDGTFQVRGSMTGNVALSDTRLKDGVRAADPVALLKSVLALPPVHYTWRPEALNYFDVPLDDEQTGLLAQDVQAVVPGAVIEVSGLGRPGAPTRLGVEWTKLTPHLVGAVHALHARLAKAEDTIKEQGELIRQQGALLQQLLAVGGTR